MEKVKLGVIGLGNMGSSHLSYLCDMPNVEVVGVCDIVHELADKFAEKYASKAFYSHGDMFKNSDVEAIIIAVPHYDHIPITVEAFARGIHVLCEKPLTVHVNGVKKMIEAYELAKKENSKIVFGLMYQERTNAHLKKIKDIIQAGDLGKLARVTWINTKWFRSQAYYDSGGWRATWEGEGGGILTNQCPHNLDTYNWLFGLPRKVNGFAHIGKYHNIEVEDEVTAYMEHENGMIGHFIVSTAECPGTNRLEIVGENGTLIYENQKLVFYKNRMSMLKFLQETKATFDTVETWEINIPVNSREHYGHKVVTEKFVESILTGEIDLIAHGTEGLDPVSLANGIMLSSFEERAVYFPLDGDLFENKLNELIEKSKFVKNKSGGNTENSDFGKSFNN